MKFRDRLARFFYGRYGIDAFYYALFVLFLVLWAGELFIPLRPVRIVISVLRFAVFCFMMFRVFSRNIYKRRIENDRFLKVWKPVKNFFILTKNRIRDFKTHRYVKCSHCKATLRLPKRKGEHPVICPCCKKRFVAKIRF